MLPGCPSVSVLNEASPSCINVLLHVCGSVHLQLAERELWMNVTAAQQNDDLMSPVSLCHFTLFSDHPAVCLNLLIQTWTQTSVWFNSTECFCTLAVCYVTSSGDVCREHLTDDLLLHR